MHSTIYLIDKYENTAFWINGCYRSLDAPVDALETMPASLVSVRDIDPESVVIFVVGRDLMPGAGYSHPSRYRRLQTPAGIIKESSYSILLHGVVASRVRDGQVFTATVCGYVNDNLHHGRTKRLKARDGLADFPGGSFVSCARTPPTPLLPSRLTHSCPAPVLR
jgi:hypothetical protein